MGTFAGNALIDELARRLRDTTNTGYARADVLTILNDVQQIVNARLGLVLGSTTFTSTNSAFCTTSGISSSILRVVDVRDGNRVLSMTPWARLLHEHPRWLRLTGSRGEVWATVGRELVAVIP